MAKVFVSKIGVLSKDAIKKAKAKAKSAALSQLKRAIRDAAKDVGAKNPVIGGVDGKAYEVWVVLSLAARFHKAGAGFAITPCDNAGKATKKRTWRVGAGPRDLTDTTSDAEKAGFLLVATPDPIEIHNSLIHKGGSGSEHEIDVSIVKASAASAIRAGGGGAFIGKPEQGFELKDYAAGTALNKNIARALLGVGFDLDALTPQIPGAVASDPGRLILGTRTTLTRPTRDMLAYYDVTGAEDLTPTNAAVLDKVVAKWP